MANNHMWAQYQIVAKVLSSGSAPFMLYIISQCYGRSQCTSW